MAYAGRAMQIDDRRPPGALRIAIGHAEHDAFLKAHDVTEVGWKVPEHRQFRGARIAKHRGHPEFSQEANGYGAHCRHDSPHFLIVQESEPAALAKQLHSSSKVIRFAHGF